MRIGKLRGKKSAGFTIIETIAVLCIFTIMLIAINTLFLSVFKNPKQQFLSSNNIDGARIVTSNFANELRDATMGNDGSFPLNQATNSQIIFYSSAGGNGTIIKRVRYYLSNNVLYKGIVVPSGSPLTYNLSSEVVKPILSGLGNGTSPVFYYYDGTYNGSGTPLSQPINVNQVKFIKINLMVPNQISAKDTSTFSISNGATIRNLKTNLGN